MNKLITSHADLDVYKMAFDAAMKVFGESKKFPKEELYSPTDQIRRASRSVCGNIAEAWRKRRYELAFLSKLSDAEAEAAETQVWLAFAVKCGYINVKTSRELYICYDNILGKIVNLIAQPQSWLLPNSRPMRRE